MQYVVAAIMILGLWPIGCALWANRRTSLAHALVWALAAWLAWATAAALDMPAARYVALCMTGCAGVAVLGARRPHVTAWNFVVLGLLAVMLLPLVEEQILGTRSTQGLRVFFLAGTIAVGILNYLPTRLAPASVLMMIACAAQMVVVFEPSWLPARPRGWGCDAILALTPWLAAVAWRRRVPVSAFDRMWLDFRDRWGFVWSQRVREQFNLAIHNAGSPATLQWLGLRKGGGDEEKHLETLRAVLQRYLEPDHHL